MSPSTAVGVRSRQQLRSKLQAQQAEQQQLQQRKEEEEDDEVDFITQVGVHVLVCLHRRDIKPLSQKHQRTRPHASLGKSVVNICVGAC